LQLEDDSGEPNIEPPPDLSQPVIHNEVGPTHLYLSLNTRKGGTVVGTIQFLAYIDKLPVTVLVDGGSFDNFLQCKIFEASSGTRTHVQSYSGKQELYDT